jgi:pimeloyl-ACP methyl ester carboxylesterase
VSATGWTAEFLPSAVARRAELRSYRGFVRLLGRRVAQPPRGAQPVVLVPGFISGDVSLACLARSLRRAGLRTFRSRIGANVGCTEAMVSLLIRRLESVVADEGRPVALVGHSRGGMIVALAARRRPDLVAGVVVLAAPVTGSLSVAPRVRSQLELLFRLNRRGVRRVLGEECVTGACADRVVHELSSPFPSSLPYTSVYSRNDAILDWRACLDPGAEQVEVAAGHTAMALDPAVQWIVVERLKLSS